MDWVADNAILPAVASMSLGGSGSYAEDEVLTNLDASGVLVVVAAGNSDYESCRRSPARSREVSIIVTKLRFFFKFIIITNSLENQLLVTEPSAMQKTNALSPLRGIRH